MSEPVYLQDYRKNSANVVTVGTFDGVHLGHLALIRNVVAHARKQNAPAVVVTFDPHPRDIITPSSVGIRLLTTLAERATIMREYGINDMVVIPFSRDFSMLPSEKFIRDFIHDKIGVSSFVIGYDHHFGRDRQGSINTLYQLSEELGFTVYVEQAHEVAHTTISSTVIRRMLEEEGDVLAAAEMLGRPYEMTGTIVKGDKRGREIGFPTANLNPDSDRKVIPARGVYCVEAELEHQLYRGMMNIGVRPTFDKGKNVVPEVHLFNFNRSIYGSSIKVRFLQRIRGEKKFNTPEALIQQLRLDRDQCVKIENRG